MHLIINELLTEEQLKSPRRYLHQLCEMYDWTGPEVVEETVDSYTVLFTDLTTGKARIRRRLVNDGCWRLGITPLQVATTGCDTRVVLPKYKK